MTDQQIEDAQAIASLGEKEKKALFRLLERVERDVFREFAENSEKKSWLKGARRVLGDIDTAIRQTAADAQAVREEMRQAEQALISEASGSGGDLAIG